MIKKQGGHSKLSTSSHDFNAKQMQIPLKNVCNEDFIEGLAELEADILDDIDLSFSNLCDEDMYFLSAALAKNTHCTKLDLRFNKIRPRGAYLLAEALQVNQSLLHLHLWSNQLGPEGTEHLCGALLQNTTLLTLDLGENNLQNDGFFKLLKMLKVNRTLKNLYLWSNGISSSGVDAFARFLKLQEKEEGTVYLGCLDLQYNNIGAEGDKQLAAIVEHTHEAVIRAAYQAPQERKTIRLSWSSTPFDGETMKVAEKNKSVKEGWANEKEGEKYHGDNFPAHRLLNNVNFCTERADVAARGAVYPDPGIYEDIPTRTFPIGKTFAPTYVHEHGWEHPLHLSHHPSPLVSFKGQVNPLLADPTAEKLMVDAPVQVHDNLRHHNRLGKGEKYPSWRPQNEDDYNENLIKYTMKIFKEEHAPGQRGLENIKR